MVRLRLATLFQVSPADLGGVLDVADINDLLLLDETRGLWDTWLKTGVTALVGIANALGGKMKLPGEGEPMSIDSINSLLTRLSK